MMRRHNQTLYRTARSILKDDAEAEDAVQEAYLLACRSIAKFRGDAKLSTWLVRIVANEALGRLRKRQRRADIVPLHPDPVDEHDSVEATMGDGAPEPPERAALRAEMRRLLEAKIDELPEALRTVFVLRSIEGMGIEEVAACLGLPAATVRTRHFRARSQLRHALEREAYLGFEDAFSFAGERCDRIVAGVLRRLDGG
jgi:RNA polymerase sigma-70 factor (ECF subfamily)